MRPPDELHDALENQGLEHYSLGITSHSQLLLAIYRLRTLFSRSRFDLIHAHEALPAMISGMVARTVPRASSVYFRGHTEGGKRLRLVSRMAGIASHFTMGASEAVAKAAHIDDRTPPNRIRVVANGVPDIRRVSRGELSRLRIELGIDPGDRVICSVARLRPEKGLPVLLTAMSSVARSEKGAHHLVIVGDGPETERLRHQASTYSSFRTHFVGHQNDVAPWYALADLIALPSQREAFGLVAAEAMAAGRAVVASRVGGLPQVIEDGLTGLLVEPGNPQLLAGAISALMSSPSRRLRMGDEGRRRYETHFTLASMADRWKACWLEFNRLRRED